MDQFSLLCNTKLLNVNKEAQVVRWWWWGEVS